MSGSVRTVTTLRRGCSNCDHFACGAPIATILYATLSRTTTSLRMDQSPNHGPIPLTLIIPPFGYESVFSDRTVAESLTGYQQRPPRMLILLRDSIVGIRLWRTIEIDETRFELEAPAEY